MRKIKSYFLVLNAILLVSISSCNVIKNIEEGELLYTGAELQIKRNGKIPDRQELYAKLEAQIKPQANKKFLGIAYTRLWLNQNIREPKKDKGLRNWLKYKIGKPAVLYTSVKPKQVELFLRKQLQDKGQFNTSISINEIKNKRKISLEYQLTLETPYRIGNVIAPTTDIGIDSLIRSFYKAEKLDREISKAYSLEFWEEKREELANYIRNQGFFNFSKRYIYYYVDTSLGRKEVDIHIRSSASKDSTVFKKYYLRNISVNAAYRLEDLGDLDTVNYNGIQYLQDIEYVKPKALSSLIAQKRGATYSQKNHSYTLNQLLQLNIFKFVNIQYSKVSGDSLDVKILLTPTQYQDVNVDLEASTTNTNFLGASIQTSYVNRHLFKRANQLEIILSLGSEFQVGGNRSLTNILDISGKVNYYLPKLLALEKWQKRKQLLQAKTRFSFVNSYQKWFKLYTLNSTEISASYDWTGSRSWRQSFSPLSFTRVNLINSDTELRELLETNPLLRTSFEEVMILAQKYNLQFDTKDPKRPLKEYWWLSLKMETAGNLFYGIFSATNASKPYTPINVPFSQYTLVDFDLRHYWIINENTSFIARFNSGLGLSYGNSSSMPYIKQFYLGGPSSLRAFRFRGIGPGTYINDSNVNTNSIDQAGDIKLLVNLEYRFTLYRFFKAALFADMGNVWLLRADSERQGGTFYANSFYKQLAIGSGIGLRLDFDIFVIRLDVGVPLRKPYLAEGKEWINNFTENNWRDWRKNNLLWNIAIGYPF